MSSQSPIKCQPEAWSGGDTLLAKAVARPMVRFMRQEAASGVLLLIATAAALLWANFGGDSYGDFWHTKLKLSLGETEILYETLGHLVNDALMVIFFFVVGLEIKHELAEGDLKDPRVAALPAIAALGGMLVPAVLYFAINASGEGSGGWGIPMATDIAFALGVLALMGPRVPQKLKLFLLTLAIVDDIGAILVIAAFYTSSIAFGWLSLAMAGVLLIILMRRLDVWYIPVYVLVGVVIWYATLKSGVHATIAGVVLGLLAPAKPLVGKHPYRAVEDMLSGDKDHETIDPLDVREANWHVRETVAVTTRLTHLLAPWTSFVIIPLFALSNAGVVLSSDSISAALSSSVALGIVLGLVIGKPLGIFLATWIAVKLKIATLPKELSFSHVLGGGAVAGIGFTLSLFIARLAFEEEAVQILDESIMGILAASAAATLLGFILLSRASKKTRPGVAESSV